MHLVVGRVGRPHGLRGEVRIEVRTDEPEVWLAPGSSLFLQSESGPLITVEAARWHGRHLVVRFEGHHDRTSVEALNGRWLLRPALVDESTGDPDEWYDHQLVGLQVRDEGGSAVGEVTQVVHLPGQDLLAVQTPDGERLVPLAAALVPVVDVAGGFLVVADRPGLLAEDGEQR